MTEMNEYKVDTKPSEANGKTYIRKDGKSVGGFYRHNGWRVVGEIRPFLSRKDAIEFIIERDRRKQ